jgi:hypothetical protein
LSEALAFAVAARPLAVAALADLAEVELAEVELAELEVEADELRVFLMGEGDPTTARGNANLA